MAISGGTLFTASLRQSIVNVVPGFRNSADYVLSLIGVKCCVMSLQARLEKEIPFLF